MYLSVMFVCLYHVMFIYTCMCYFISTCIFVYYIYIYIYCNEIHIPVTCLTLTVLS